MSRRPDAVKRRSSQVDYGDRAGLTDEFQPRAAYEPFGQKDCVSIIYRVAT
jgi:hypothetical protein